MGDGARGEGDALDLPRLAGGEFECRALRVQVAVLASQENRSTVRIPVFTPTTNADCNAGMSARARYARVNPPSSSVEAPKWHTLPACIVGESAGFGRRRGRRSLTRAYLALADMPALQSALSSA